LRERLTIEPLLQGSILSEDIGIRKPDNILTAARCVLMMAAL
jgi:hypothetical protein